MQTKTGYPSHDRNHEDFYGRQTLEIPFPENQTIYDYIYNQNRHRLSLPAINYFDNQISYRKFLESSNRAAAALVHFGVKKGDYITAIVPNIPEAFYLLLGASRIGAVVNFVDPRYGEQAIEQKIRGAHSNLIIAFDGSVATQNRYTGKTNRQHVLNKVGNTVGSDKDKIIIGLPASESVSLVSLVKNDYLRSKLFEKDESDFKRYYSWKEFFKAGSYARDLSFPVYEEHIPVAAVSTGGTTGFPKTATFDNEGIIKATFQCRLTGIFPEEARWYDIMPPSIAYGLADGSILPFSLGNEVRLNPDPTLESLKTKGQLLMVEDFVRFDPHTIACAPNHVFAILDSKEWQKKKHSLINFIVGGDSLNENQVQRADEILKRVERPKKFDEGKLLHGRPDVLKINTGWGSTEVVAAASVAPGSEHVKKGTVGLTLPHEVVSAFVKAEDGDWQELPYVTNEQLEDSQEIPYGELCVHGPNKFQQYLNNADETARVVITHADGLEWVHLGDEGFIDEDGYVHYVSREKYIGVGHDGFKVAPLEIESVILQEEQVDACKAVIFADPENEHGQVIKVYYTLLDSDQVCEIEKLEENMNLRCSLALADYKCPYDYECIEKLPITPSGKIDIEALKADAEAKYAEKGKQKIMR